MLRVLILSSFFLILCVNSILSQVNRNQLIPERVKIIGDFLRSELDILPGEQLYRAQDLWESLGSKKMKTDEPKNNKGKDITKTLKVDDAGEFVDGFLKFSYQAKNETITTLTFSTELEKGDYFIDKFVGLEGRYDPIKNNSKAVEYSGSYTFDDFKIRITEYSKDPKIEFVITKNPSFNRIRTKR